MKSETNLAEEAAVGMIIEMSDEEILAQMTPEDHADCELLRQRILTLLDEHDEKRQSN